MKQCKYIIVECMGHEVPIVFADLLNHSDVAENFKVVSAGMCDIHIHDMHHGITVTTWGESTSLKKIARPEDANIIERFLNL